MRPRSRRRRSCETAAGKWRLALWLLAPLVAFGCTETDPVFQSTGTLRMNLLDGGLVLQTAPTPGIQMTSWELDEATFEVTGGPTFDNLQTTPCTYTHNVASLLTFLAQCGTPGLALSPGTATVRLRLGVAGMEVRRATRPDLPDNEDHDGDGVLNVDDNCDLIPNPTQDDINADGVGDACSIVDALSGDPTIPDQDGDGVADFADNCVWVSNPTQDDLEAQATDLATAAKAGIGDVCEEVAPVTLPGGRLDLDLGPLDIPVVAGSISTFLVDFDNRLTLTCDPAFTSCTLDPAGVDARTF